MPTLFFFFSLSFSPPFMSVSFHVLRQHGLLFIYGLAQDETRLLSLSQVFVYSLHFAPVPSVSASARFESGLSLALLGTPRAHSPGPPCGMLYSVRPMEEGHPGTQHECTRTHTHAHAVRGTRKHAHTDKYSCSEPSQPRWQMSKSKRVAEGGLRLDRKRRKKKTATVSMYVVLNLAVSGHITENRLPRTRGEGYHQSALIKGCPCISWQVELRI